MKIKTESGKVISGEIIPVENSQSLISNMDEATKPLYKWDAYVAANAFAHDLSETGISQEQIMRAAKKFWFHDEDMSGDNKVYWYFKDKIFG